MTQPTLKNPKATFALRVLMAWETHRLCTGREFSAEKRWLEAADSLGRLDPVRWADTKPPKEHPMPNYTERCWLRVEVALRTMPMPQIGWVMQRSDRRRKDAERMQRDALRALARGLAHFLDADNWPEDDGWAKVKRRLGMEPAKVRDELYRRLEEGGRV